MRPGSISARLERNSGPGLGSGPLLGDGVEDLLAERGRTVRLEINVFLAHPEVLRQQTHSRHRWAGDPILEVVHFEERGPSASANWSCDSPSSWRNCRIVFVIQLLLTSGDRRAYGA